MSITKDFETKAFPGDLTRLLAHTRSLEAMLKKHEWSYRGSWCPECSQSEYNGHLADCHLAKLLEGVE